MTDDIDGAVPAAELRELSTRASLEATARGLRVLPATFRDPDVVFTAPSVSLDEVLDLAVQVGAPFVTVDVEDFDAADFLEDVDVVPIDLRNAAGSHDGDRSGMNVQFFGAGVSYVFWARADWWRDLTAELAAWHEREDEDRGRDRGF